MATVSASNSSMTVEFNLRHATGAENAVDGWRWECYVFNDPCGRGGRGFIHLFYRRSTSFLPFSLSSETRQLFHGEKKEIAAISPQASSGVSGVSRWHNHHAPRMRPKRRWKSPLSPHCSPRPTIWNNSSPLAPRNFPPAVVFRRVNAWKEPHHRRRRRPGPAVRPWPPCSPRQSTRIPYCGTLSPRRNCFAITRPWCWPVRWKIMMRKMMIGAWSVTRGPRWRGICCRARLRGARWMSRRWRTTSHARCVIRRCRRR